MDNFLFDSYLLAITYSNMPNKRKYDNYQVVEISVEAVMSYRDLTRKACHEAFDVLNRLGTLNLEEIKKAVHVATAEIYTKITHELKDDYDFI